MITTLKNKIRKMIFDDGTDEHWWEIRNKAIKAKGIFALIYRNQYYRLLRKRNANIPLNTYFEGRPILPHGLSGIYISEKAEIGKNVVIFHQVTIGSNTLKDAKDSFGAPKIEENCYIGAGAKIIGSCIIGSGTRIGANCICVKDIPMNSTVVLSEPRVILHKEVRDNYFGSVEEISYRV